MRGILIETFAAAVVILPVFLLLWKVRFHDFRRSVLYTFFAMYLAAVYFLVGMPTIQFHTFDATLNLIPFAGMLEDFRNEILNVLLFVPLGTFLPLLWKKYRRMKATICFGFGMTLSIEVLQLFTFRATDVNDIITNSLGSLLGYLLFRAIVGKLPLMAGSDEGAKDLPFIILIVAVVMFFVQPNIISIIYAIV